jgi:hypothetical protein
MDIEKENNNFPAEAEMPMTKTNILVIGERKSGKTSIIKSSFELSRVVPKTYFLCDSVKIWEGTVASESGPTKLAFIETDVEVPVLDQLGKFEETLRGHHNILCLIVKNSESPTLKTQNRIRVFFEKFRGIYSFFSECVVVTNNYLKKKDTSNEIQEIYNFEMNRLFSSKKCY